MMLGDIDLTLSKQKINLFLCKPNKEIIAKLSEAFNINLQVNSGNINELSFDLPYEIEKNHVLQRNDNIDLIRPFYLVKLTLNNTEEWFRIEKPKDMMSDSSDYKSIQCYSLPIEMKNKIIRRYEVESKNATEILTDLLKSAYEVSDVSKALWKISYIHPDFNNTYRLFNISKKTLLDFILNDIQTTFNAVVMFDTVNRTISLYRKEDLGENKGLKFDYGKYLKTIDKELDGSYFCTKLKCYGKDVDITEINPLGTPYLYDFSYYLYPYEEDELGNILQHSYYMSDSLAHDTIAYMNKITSKDKENAFADTGTTNLRLYLPNHGLTNGDYILNRTRKNEYRKIKKIDDNIVEFELFKKYILFAEENTTTTTVYISGHGLDTGDYVVNKSRSDARRQITKLDDDSFSVAEIVGQKVGDKFELEKYTISNQSSGDLIYKFKDGTFGKLLYQEADLQNELIDLQNELYYLKDSDYILDNGDTRKCEIRLLDEISILEDLESRNAEEEAELQSLYTEYNTRKSEIDSKNVEITTKQTAIDNKIIEKQNLRNSLSLESNFNENQLQELQSYIIDQDWEDQNYLNAYDLYDEGIKKFSEINSPITNISIDIVNFLEVVECQHDWHKLVLGDEVLIKNDKLNINNTSSIIGINYDFENYNIKLIIGDIKNTKTKKDEVLDLLYKSVDASDVLKQKQKDWNIIAENFDTRNDRIATIPADPTFDPAKIYITSVKNTDGSANITFKWDFEGSGDAYNIDGFIIYVRMTFSNTPYVFGSMIAQEQTYYVSADKKNFVLYGAPANRWYTFGVQSYRKVDSDIHSSGYLKSNIAKVTEGENQNPHRPSDTVDFVGNITGTIDGKLASDITNFIDVLYPQDLSDLQSQIDGKIESWFYDYVPTLLNLPASDWTTNELKDNHLGDLFYDTSTGYAYRFALIDSVYQWIRITDSDVLLALENASKAQITADNKRTVFISEPTTPYQIGDLWRVSANDVDFKICTTERLTGDYVSSDWVWATNVKGYVDGQISDLDSAISILDTTIDNAFSDNKITNIEANTLKIAFQSVGKEASDVMAIANGLGLSENAYYLTCLSAYSALQTEIAKWVNKPSYPIDIESTDRTNIEDKFKNLEGAIANLYNAIDSKRNNDTISYIDGEVSELNIAITGLESDINNFSLDSILTLAEANALKISLNQVNAESTDIISIATSLNITTEKTNYSNALNTLTTYLNDNWLPDGEKIYPLSITTLQRTDIIDYFKNVESTKTILNNKILAEQSVFTEENIKDYIDTSIQPQIDGKIETYFQETDPNIWSVEDRLKHDGDMWYNTSTKELKRYDSTTNTWKLIEDKTAIDAYENASKAQITADNKRTVFISEPTTPYQIGDLWRVSANDVDFKICTTERLTGDYVSSDWVWATNVKGYVDGQISDLDSAISILDTTIDNAFSDNKITNIEANTLKIAFQSVGKEASDVMAIANGLGLSENAYYLTCLSAYSALQTEIAKWVNKPSYPIDIESTDRTNIEDKFKNLEGAIANLYNAIDSKRNNDTISYIDGEVSELNIAITGLESDINNFSLDSILTLAEANALKISLNQVNAESTDIISIATSLNITTEKTNYSNALNTLTTYLNDNWLPDGEKIYPLSITTLQRTDIIDYFKNVESTKTILNNKILAEQSVFTEENIKDYIDTSIQPQIDGKIETYFQETDPNIWSVEDRLKHDGDMWYNTSTKELKRYDSTTNTWKLIEDKTAIDAYENASKAQITADNKRTVFISEPTTPYQIGDLWRVSANDVDFKICTTERLTGDYVSSDWVWATNVKGYVDGQISDLDSAISILDTTIDNAFSDNKITNIEANTLKIAFQSVGKEASDVMAIANGLGLSENAYYLTCLSAYSALQTEIAKWVNKPSYPIDIESTDRTNIEDKFKNLEGAIANLYNAIDSKRNNDTISYIDGEVSELNIAITGLESDINNFSLDSILTLAEANALKISLNQVNAESTDIISIATSLNITTEKTNYSNALNTLTTYLNDNWLPDGETCSRHSG
jgi:hypothetical protein